MEVLSRRYQLWEAMCSTELAAAEMGPGHEDWLDERHVFLGKTRSRGSALVAPELESFVAERLEEQSAVLKERRKAREERALVRGGRPSEQAEGDAGRGGRRGGRGGR